MTVFDDGKDAGAMRSIGEVSEALGIKPHVLRYWEEQFPSLSPLKRAGGRRLYRAEDVALIERINNLLSREGYTLKGARAALAGGSQTAPASTARDPREHEGTSDLLGRLKAIRSNLADALAS